MFRILSITFAVALCMVGILLAYASGQPDSFRVERSISVNASPDKVYSLVNDFHQMQAWSPYEKLDPAMKRIYSGASKGKGSSYIWESTGKAGVGRMEIVDTSKPSKVIMQLDFIKPFQARNTAEYTMHAEGTGTKVTWAMYGPNPLVAKVIHLFINMDNMVGKDFETGLSNLKALAEQSA